VIILKDILYKVAIEAVKGSTEMTINKIEFDSRKIIENDVFVAIRGTVSNGHDFIEKAINLGATVIVCDTLPEVIVTGVTYIQVKDTNTALAFLAANYYGNPSQKLKLVGIPDSLTINYYLAEMSEMGIEYCFMEVSSHGIHQKRTEALHFEGGVFTNLSHDHLDYHPTFADYRDVKKLFFDYLPKSAFALTNIDDKNGLVMIQNTVARKLTYALKSYADYKAQILENQLSGLLLKINENEVWVRLIGTFNAYNLLAIYATAVELGMDKLEALRLLSELESVSGRFQFIVSDTKVTAIVDYAHTPDALENVLKTINDIRTNNEQLITVVGCGGDRDKTKRPIMANIASTMSNKVIITSDNPRTEDPIDIIADMEEGVQPQNQRKTLSIVDRKQAIKTACQLASQNDIILIAGKGHETYQEINGVRHDFDDMEIVKETLEQLNK